MAPRSLDPHEHPAPRPLMAVAALVALQGAGLLAVALYFLVRLVLDRPADLLGVIGVLVLAALGGAALLAVARGLRAGRGWSRSPALVTQLVLVPVALAAVPSAAYLGIPLLVWAGVIMVLLFVPAVSAALQR